MLLLFYFIFFGKSELFRNLEVYLNIKVILYGSVNVKDKQNSA